VGGVLRLRRGTAALGILITHLGIALLLVAGFVKMYYSQDGHLTLYEAERSNEFQSYFRWEIAISEYLAEGELREHLIPQEDFLDATDSRAVTLTSADLPFDLVVSRFMANCRPMLKGPMFDVDVPVVDGAFLRPLALSKTAEQNVAGIYVEVRDKLGGAPRPGILWGLESEPLMVSSGGRSWAVGLRHERYSMPFTIVLDKFTKEDHPRISMAKEFSSDVRVIEGDAARPIKISMNEPLRDEGLVLYQASWGPSNARPGDPLFSTLSVVRNPADQYPLYACIVIAAGLLIHFLRKLTRYVRSEARKAA
jgi:cytochrome c biogenesis protein ResB